MNSDTAGLILNVYLIMRRHQRVLAATGDNRLANKAAWHTYGLIWLAGWAFIAPLGCLFLALFSPGFLVAAGILALLIPVWFYAWSADRRWEATLSAQAIEPPPIPEQYPMSAPERTITQPVLTAFYRPPAKQIRSAR
jgi:hypothetical protein